MVSTSINNFEKIPIELKQTPQWVAWRLEKKDGKDTKVPYIAAEGIFNASTTDPLTWRTYQAAVKALDTGRYSGIGFVVSEYDDFGGLDLDHCRNPETGEIDQWALDIIGKFNSYTEVTPSGAGVRIWIKAKFPVEGHKKTGYGPQKAGALELYDNKRYFAVTGDHIEGTPVTIEDRQAELDELYRSTFPPKEEQPPARNNGHRPASIVDDTLLLAKAMSAANGAKFERLFRGDTSDYNGDDSSADQALCNMLSFWTDKDFDRIDRLFRQSGLYRQKWERQDYREGTIKHAIEITAESYCDNNNYINNNVPPNTQNEANSGQKRDKSGTSTGQRQDKKAHGELSSSFDEVLKDAGHMSRRDIAGTLGVQVGDAGFRKLVQRRIKEGQVRWYRDSSETLEWINRDYKILTLDGAQKTIILPITLPMGLNNWVKVPAGSVIGVAGFTSAGKTALMLEIAELNVESQQMPIYYWFNEMSKERMLLRLEDYPRLQKAMGKQFRAVKQADFEFYDVLEPDAINLIDYIDLDGDKNQQVYLIGSVVKKLQQKLGSGVVIFAQQKPKDSDMGYGGVFSVKLSNLYLSMDTIHQDDLRMDGRCKVIKAKDWEARNPVGLYCNYYTSGKHGRIFSNNVWTREKNDK